MKNPYETLGDVTCIFIKHKEEIIKCLINTTDLELVKSIRGTWKSLNGKHAYTDTYTWGTRESVQMHRLIMGLTFGDNKFVDHKDRNGFNNTRSNLEVVTNAQNSQNRGIQANNKSGIPGVYWKKDKNKWCGRIKLKGKHHFIGYFDDLDTAKEEMDKARLRLHDYYREVIYNDTTN